MIKRVVKALSVGFLLILAAAGVLYYFLQQYLSSPEFSEDLSRMALEKVDGDLSFSNLEVAGVSLQAEEIQLQNSGKIKNLKTEGLTTKFGSWSLFQRSWKMSTLQCDKLDVHITRKKAQSHRAKPTSDKRSEGSSSVKSEPKKTLTKKRDRDPFYKKLTPNTVEFNKIAVKEFSGEVERRSSDPVSWQEVMMKGDIKDETLKLELTGGSLYIPIKILNNWKINTATVLATEDDYELRDAKFLLDKGGRALVNGGGQMSGGDLSVEMELRDVPLESLLKKQNKYVGLSGIIDGDLKAVTEDKETLTHGLLTLHEGVVELPSVAKHLLQYIALDKDNELKLDQCSAEITHVDDTTVLENLNLSVGNAYKVVGLARLDDDDYTLQCHLGLSAKALSLLPASLQSTYTEQGDHYWVPINMTGHKDDLAKDLGTRAATSLGVALVTDPGLLDKVDKLFGSSVSDLLKGEKGEKLKEKGLKALEKLFR